MKIYVAASWRTASQPIIVQLLRDDGHEVYDFRADGFSWREIDPDWRTWTPEQIRLAYYHPRAIEGFTRDRKALDECDVCVLVQPCGRSAHMELGYVAGLHHRGLAGTQGAEAPFTVVLLEENQEPDLMYLLCDHVVVSMDELRMALNVIKEKL